MTVTYTANTDTTATVTYIDDDNGNSIVGNPEVITGATDSEGSYTIKIPEGYEIDTSKPGMTGLADGDTKTLILKANDDDNVVIYLKHKIDGPNTPKNPTDPNYADTHKTITETINYVKDNGQKIGSPKTQTLNFTRTVTIDEVSGDKTYGAWTPETTDSFSKVDSPTVPGYTADKPTINAVTGVTADDDDYVFNVTYTAQDTTAKVTYVDDDNGGAAVGTPETVTGKTDSTGSYTVKIPKGYVVDTSKTGMSTIVDGGALTIKFKADDSDNVVIYLKHKVVGPTTPTSPTDPDYDQTHQSVTETINYVKEDGTQAAKSSTQTITFTRTVTTDEATGKKTYGAWKAETTDGFNKVDSPAVSGYTPDIPSIDAVTGVKGDDQDITKTVTYKANTDTTATVTYVDQTTGKSVKVDTVTGTTDQGQDYTVDIPSGYELAPSQNVTIKDGKVTIVLKGDDSDNVIINLTHSTTVVNPGDTDPIPGPSGKTGDDYKDDMTDTITRTIHYKYADGSEASKDVTETVTYTRSITVDNVTGEIVSTTDWVAKDSKTSFSDATSPVLPGYNASQNVVNGGEVVAGQKDQDITVTYTADANTQATITYVDDDNNGSTVGNPVVMTGTTDTEGNYVITVPKGYVIDDSKTEMSGIKDGDTITFTYKADKSDDRVIYLKHKIDGPDTPKDPSDPDYAQTHQSVTETVNYVKEDGSKAADTVTKTINFTRDVTTDEATGTKTYGAWKAETTDGFDKIDSPAVAGYTPDVPSVDAVTGLTGDSKDITKTVTYKANTDTTANVTYIDETTGKSVKVDTVTGTTDQGTDYVVNVPNGYVIDASRSSQTNGDTISVVVKADNSDDLVIYLKHDTKDVTPPTNTTDPYYKETHESVNQTINYQYADSSEAAKSVTNTLDFTRNITVDAVTGDVISTGAWTAVNRDQFGAVTSPKIAGYTPTQQIVPAVTVRGDDPDSTITVIYNANTDTTAKVHYVDEDNGNKEVKTDTITGTTGEKGNGIVDIPSGCVIDTSKSNYANGDQLTTTLTGDDTDDITIYLKHDTKDVTPTDPSDPNYDATHQTVTETVNYVKGDGSKAADTVTKTLNFTRTATVDSVTGKVIKYGDWTAVTGDTFDDITSPDVAGYTPDQTVVKGAKVTGDSKDINATVTYTANTDTGAKVTYIDQTTGKVVTTDDQTGTTDQSQSYNVNIPDGYELAPSQTATIKDGKVTITFKADDSDNVTIYLTHGSTVVNPGDTDPIPGPSGKTGDDYKDDMTDTITRTIHYKYADGSEASKDVTETVTYTRSVTVDNVTGEITGTTDWVAKDSKTSFSDAVSPDIPGYNASQNMVNGGEVVAGQKDQDITVTYTADTNTQATITYVDDDNNGSTVGNPVVMTGTTDEEGNYVISVPKGYVIDDSKTEMSGIKDGDTITFTYKADKSDDRVIYLKHATNGPSTPTDPKNPNYDDTHKTVTETVTYVKEDGTSAAETVTKTLDFTREVTTDAVTGAVVKYGEWTAVAGDTFDDVTSPDVAGYTPDQSVVKGTQVTGDSADINTVVTYTAKNDTTASVTYIDETTGKSVKVDTVTGTTDQGSDYVVNVPNGYVIDASRSTEVNGSTISIVVKADNSDDRVIYLKHDTKDVTPPTNTTDPYYKETHESVNQTINYQYADGSEAAGSVTKTLDFTRNITVDAVTGDVISTGDWTAVNGNQFDAVTSPKIAGYTPTQQIVPAVTVRGDDPDSTITVVYNANTDTTAKVHYVDEDNGNKEVKTDTITGTTGQEGDGTVDIPAGYEIDTSKSNYANGDQIKTTLTGDNSDDVTIYLKHSQKEVTPTTPSDPNYDATHQTVTETVNYVKADGSKAADTVTKTLNFTRTVTTDAVTGAVIKYGDWTAVAGDTFDDITSPDVAGYTPDQTVVKGTQVTGDSKDINTTVTYTANTDTQATVTYVDQTTGKTVKTDNLTGTTDKSEDYNVNIPDGYVLSPSQTVTINNGKVTVTYKADDSDNVVIYLTHGSSTVNPGDTDPIPGPSGKTGDDYKNDMTDTITRTIHYKYADGTSAGKDVTETITYTRSITVDNVTGAIISTTDWVAQNGDTAFDDVTSPDVPGYNASQKVVQGSDVVAGQKDQDITVTYTADTNTQATITYVDDDNNGSTVGNPVVMTGTTDEEGNYVITVPKGYVIDDSKAEMQGVKDGDTITFTYKADKSDDHVIYLKHKQETVGPDDKNYSDETNWTITETVHYVTVDGNQVHKDTVKKLTYTRDIVVDAVTGEVISRGDWKATNGDTFAGFDTPAVKHYVADRKNIGSFTVEKPGATGNIDLNVYYYDDEVPVDPGHTHEGGDKTDPNNPESPKFPEGVGEADLNQDVTETIHYVDAKTGKELAQTYTKTVHYSRSAVVHFNADGTASVTYSDWKADGTFGAVESPTVKGYVADRTSVENFDVEKPTANMDLTVYYYADEVPVDPGHTHEGGDKTDPNNPESPKFPEGVGEADLNQDVTETIHYVDAKTGKELAQTYTKTVHYSRSAVVHFNADGTASVTYSDWKADGTFGAVESPEVAGYTADRKVVQAFEVNGPTADMVLDVYYTANDTSNPDNNGNNNGNNGNKGNNGGDNNQNHNTGNNNGNNVNNGGNNAGNSGNNSSNATSSITNTGNTTTGQNNTRAEKYGNVSKKLPQTGDKDNASTSAIGVLGLLAGMFGLFGFAKKRKRDDEE